MTNRVRVIAAGCAAVLLCLAAFFYDAPPAVALGESGSDLITVDLTGPSSIDDGQGLCPSSVTVNGGGIGFKCYFSEGTIIEKGSRNGQTLMLHGPWKAKCADGVVRDIGGGSVSLTLDQGTARATVAVNGRTCAGRNYIEFSRSTAAYGVGTHFYTQAY